MTSKETGTIIPLLYESYIAVIRNSVGTNLFRNFYAKVGGEVKDILENGNLSCASFVSNVLWMFQLIKVSHGTVSSTVKDMLGSGWETVKEPQIGSVLVWESQKDSSDDVMSGNKHIGFYIGNNLAISNSSKERSPKIHHWTFGEKDRKPERKIEIILHHPKLKPGTPILK